MQWIKKYWLTLLGIVLGSIAGYLYYYWVGCTSGSCAITSRPLNATMYGALMGGLLLYTFQSEQKKKDQPNA